MSYGSLIPGSSAKSRSRGLGSREIGWETDDDASLDGVGLVDAQAAALGRHEARAARTEDLEEKIISEGVSLRVDVVLKMLEIVEKSQI